MRRFGFANISRLAVLILVSSGSCESSPAASPKVASGPRADPERVEADAIVAAIATSQKEAAQELSERRSEFRWREEVAYELGRLGPDDPRSVASLADELDERGLSLQVASARLAADPLLRARTAKGVAGVETLKSVAAWMKEAKLPSAVESPEGCARLRELAIAGAGQCASPAAMAVLYLALGECDVPTPDVVSAEELAQSCAEAGVGGAKRPRR